MIHSGQLDRAKQQALYVELIDDEVLTPARLNQGQTFRMLAHAVEVFEFAGDTAFSGLDAISTPKTEWLAEEQLAIVHSAFERCEQPS